METLFEFLNLSYNQVKDNFNLTFYFVYPANAIHILLLVFEVQKCFCFLYYEYERYKIHVVSVMSSIQVFKF